MKKAYGFLDWTGVRLPAAPPPPSVALAKEGFPFDRNILSLKLLRAMVDTVHKLPFIQTNS
jgi:hypothetical protein